MIPDGNLRQRWRGAAFLGLLLLLRNTLTAQVEPVRLEGSLNLSSELYSSQGIDPRRPHSVYRAILTPTITLFDQIRLPFEIFVSSEDRGFRQPFNQFGVSPNFFGWLTLHAGYYSSRLSELTFGDARLLGAGVELTPGPLRFAFLYGRSQDAVTSDSLQGIRGTYSRTMMAAKIGYGDESDFHLHLNVVRAVDDSLSVSAPAAGVSPQENLVVSLAYGVPLLGRALQINGETAISALSNDTRSPEVSDGLGLPAWLFTPRYSSMVDVASTLSLAIVPSSWFSLRLNGRWIGPGYVSLGYAQMPNDVFETTIGPSFRLMDGKLSLRGSLGLRWNNLRNNRLSTTRRTLGTLAVSSNPSQAFGFDVSYSNYGMRSAVRNDTLRIDNVSQSITVAPHFAFQAFGASSMMMLSYAFQDFSDFNTVTSNLSNNTTHSGVALWTLAFPSSLSLTTTVMYTASVTGVLNIVVRGINETMGYSFFDNALATSLTLGYNQVTAGATDDQVTARASVTLRTHGWGSFTLSLMNNTYNYGDPTASPSFKEYQGTLQYGISF